MHEESLIRSLLRQVERVREQHGAGPVREVFVAVGEFAGVEPELLAAAFDRLSGRSGAAGARLVLRVVPLRAACRGCGEEFEVEGFRFACPACGQPRVDVIGGEELILERITVEAEG